jgi:transcriptional regulator with XRE-family HTH domain
MGIEVDEAAKQPTPEGVMGARIRDFRVSRRLSLRALASRAQTSPGFVSQLERGQVNASVGTLRKLAEGLGITLPDLFSDDDVKAPIVRRRADRPAIHEGNLITKYLLSHKPARNFEVYVVEMLPGGDAGEPYTHREVQELLVTLTGTITVELDGIDYVLEVGDSVEFVATTPHTVRNTSGTLAELLWVISPPDTGIPLGPLAGSVHKTDRLTGETASPSGDAHKKRR